MKINIKNFHFAKVAEKEGVLVYEKPVHIPGLEEITRTPQVATGKKYGDGIIRYSISKKTGYTVELNHNVIPAEIKSYMEGTTISESGVEHGSSTDKPRPFAAGWEVEKADGESEYIWFLFGFAEPISVSTKQSEDNVNFSSDTLKITFLEHESLKRFYTFVDKSLAINASVTAADFFSKVQTKDAIERASESV